ncbi:hypothetical protein [Planococcus salinarum]|uniref:hypothetical protein n=1 Tax=Planococcus salinarum TaxID=622695 RepID=UPI000E3BFEFF|nr:hypothetical protein [Planococcus salinarum]TAA72748.1 hypothetical protein D2909_05070 [Planococcus salinarum]
MSRMKKIVFYIGNIIIGVISNYAYLYLWITFSWGEPIRFFSLETLLAAGISTLLFLGFNYLMLRKEEAPKKYWGIALGVVLLSVAVILAIIEFS